MIIDAKVYSCIPLGMLGENKARVIRFDVRDIIAEFPGASFTLLNRRPDDEDAYPVSDEFVENTEGFILWAVQSGDLTKDGYGKCQIIAMKDDIIKKTVRYNTFVDESLDGVETPPEPWVSWQEEMARAVREAKEAIQHYPRIGMYTTWELWDVTEGRYVDTGIDARGTHGENAYVHFRYASKQPTKDSDMKTVPDAWMGIYSGSEASAPVHYTAYVWYKIKGETEDISNKADKTDTVLNTTLSRGRKNGTRIGNGSFAFGNDVEASGDYSHAEGYGTKASGYTGAHAEGHNTQAIDDGTHAEGYGSIASNDYAHAEGNSTIAGGYASHAEGCETEAASTYAHAEGYKSKAQNTYAHAEGYETKAIGSQSHAEGRQTQAKAESSHAEGTGSTAEAKESHAEGSGTHAYGEQSHTEGAGTRAYGQTSHAEGGGTTALAYGSHSEGGGTTAYGSNAHAEGGGSRAVGNQAHAEGGGSTAIGVNSHAEGGGTMAVGQSSHAEGVSTIANGANSHVFGRSNVEDKGSEVPPDWAPNTQYSVNDRVKVVRTYSGEQHASNVNVTQYYKCNRAHTSGETFTTSGWDEDALQYVEIVGNGNGNARSNARTLDWNGNERLKGDLFVQCESDSTNGKKVATAQDTVLETTLSRGRTNGSAIGEASVAFGIEVTATEIGAHAEGLGTTASGEYSHAEGTGTTASGTNSHAEGIGTVANGAHSHAEGQGSQTTQNCAHAEGSGTLAAGFNSHAEGSGSQARGHGSHAEGGSTQANGYCSHSEGGSTIADGEYSHALGAYNVRDNIDHRPVWEPNTQYSKYDLVRKWNDQTQAYDGLMCIEANNDSVFDQSKWTQNNRMKYVEIVGNGNFDMRSNARALDWNGNERLMGDLYVQCNSDSTGGVKVATENQLPVYATDAETMMIFANE